MNVLDEIRFWQQVIGDAKRTVLCNPDIESRCKGYVAARGLEHLITIKANPHIPADKLFIVDEQAIAATLNRPVKFRVTP